MICWNVGMGRQRATPRDRHSDARGGTTRILPALLQPRDEQRGLAIAQRLQKRTVHRFIHLEPSQGRLRARLFELGAVVDEAVLDDGSWSLELKMTETDLRRFLKREKLSREQLVPAPIKQPAPAANE